MSNKYHKILVQASLSKGVFSTESVATLSLYDGNKATLFIDDSLVATVGEKTYIKATMINKRTNPDRIKVLLPSEAFDTSSPWIEVSKDKVRKPIGSHHHDSKQC